MTLNVAKTSLVFNWPEQVAPETMENHAHAYCSGSYLDPHGCSWYHGNWKYLKSLDMVSNPYWHSHFYLRHFGHVLAAYDFANVLLCGTADDGILSLISVPILTMSYPRRITVTVLDACKTPLMVCRDFAIRHGLNLETVHGDAQRMPFQDESFDAIVTDAFLTRFPSDGKVAVVNEWQRILRVGGTVLTTARVEPGKSASFFSHPSIPNIQDRMRYALRAARRSSGHGHRPLAMARRALAYSQHMASYPFRDSSQVENLFHANGFRTMLERGAEGLREAEPRDYVLISAYKGQDTPPNRDSQDARYDETAIEGR